VIWTNNNHEVIGHYLINWGTNCLSWRHEHELDFLRQNLRMLYSPPIAPPPPHSKIKWNSSRILERPIYIMICLSRHTIQCLVLSALFRFSSLNVPQVVYFYGQFRQYCDCVGVSDLGGNGG